VGQQKFNLKQIFKAIDSNLAENEKHFKSFVLANTSITELEENTFYDITFDGILIFWNKDLRLINTKSFGATGKVTKKLEISFSPIEHKSPDYDFFEFLSSLTNIKEITCKQLNISEIPSEAFRSQNVLNELTHLSLASSGIKHLGGMAFYESNNLELLDLSNNPIETIPYMAFQMKNPSNKRLEIDLDFMDILNGLGFKDSSLSYIRRPTILSIVGNLGFTYLNESVFKPFLESNPENRIHIKNSLSFVENSIDCNDCKNYWIKKDPKFLGKIDLTHCSNGKEFMNSSNFAKCQ
jgi:Leucine-rich repeat (LRR) protein